MKYIVSHPTSGILSYRRPFPPALRHFIPKSPRELKRSLRSLSFNDGDASRIYHETAAEYERLVSEAVAKASNSQRPLSPSDIPYLVNTYAYQVLKKVEEAHFDSREEAFTLTSVPSLRYSPLGLPALDEEGKDIVVDRRERVLTLLPYSLSVWQDALGTGDREKVIEIEGPTAQDLLNTAGIAFTRGETLFFDLCLSLLHKDHEIYSAALARFRGEVVSPPVPPENSLALTSITIPAAKAESEVTSITMPDIAQAILESHRENITLSTRQQWASSLRFWQEVHPNLGYQNVRRSMVNHWLELLAQRPNRVPNHLANLPLPTLIERYEGQDDIPRLSGTTIGKHVTALSRIWATGIRRGIIDEVAVNPFINHGIRKNLPRTEGQEGFLKSELEAIFRLPLFTQGERPRGGKGEASYWIPLFLLWTGARPNEVAQLLVSDFWYDGPSGKWLMKITDEGLHPVKGQRSLKTSNRRSGVRQFPVPSALLNVGLLDYLKWLTANSEVALFPRLRLKGSDLFAGFGEWWSKYAHAHSVIAKGKRPSRELRNNFMTAARESGISLPATEYLAGHVQTGTSMNARYGTREAWGWEMEKLEYKGIDLSAVRRWTPQES